MRSFPFLFFSLSLIASRVCYSRVQLSDKAQVAIITIGPYQKEVYSAFGHSGILVRDPENNIDRFYNYGLYDFEQENFFLNFAFGLLIYKVGVSDYKRVFYYYSRVENRYIKEQDLNLNQDEKQRFFDFLEENVKPENAEYRYNYVYDNCATKLPEVTNKLFPGRISYDFSYVTEKKTIRDLMDEYLEFQPWGDFGIDVALGMQVDREASPETYLFLPEYVFKAFAGAAITRNGEELPLIKTANVFPAPKKQVSKNGVFTPFNVFLVVFFVIGFITNRDLKTGKRTRSADIVLFGFVGIVGLWILFLWLATEHLSKDNLNVLWALPLHLLALFFLRKAKTKRTMASYFKIIGIWYVLLLVVWAFLPQPLPKAAVPLVLAMALRAFYINYDLTRIVSKTSM